MILLDLRMHRAGIDRLPHRHTISAVEFQRHTALRTISRLVRFNARAHRTIILLGPYIRRRVVRSAVSGMMPLMMMSAVTMSLLPHISDRVVTLYLLHELS